MVRSLVMAVCFVMWSVAGAQGVGVLDDAAARKNLVKSPAAVYPPIAGAAKVRGDVVLEVEIDYHGRVTAARALSGPAMLRPAAIDTVSQWVFKPFGPKGKAMTVKAKLVIPVAPNQPGAKPAAGPLPMPP